MAPSGTFGFRLEGRQGTQQIQGLREVQKALNKFSGATKSQMQPTHLRAAEAVALQSRKFVPIDSGNLLTSIKPIGLKSGGRVRVGSASVPYAGPIHFGWPARRIKPQPFIYEALDTRRDVVLRIYDLKITELVKKYDLQGVNY